MNAIAAAGVEPDPAPPSMDLLLYLAESDDAARLAKDVAASNGETATPDEAAQSPTAPDPTTDRTDAGPDRR